MIETPQTVTTCLALSQRVIAQFFTSTCPVNSIFIAILTQVWMNCDGRELEYSGSRTKPQRKESV
jgi:hypothetical protein